MGSFEITILHKRLILWLQYKMARVIMQLMEQQGAISIIIRMCHTASVMDLRYIWQSGCSVQHLSL